MARRAIPDIVVGRLPVYLRALNFLIAEGRQITSSQELGDRLGISSAQIRKDLSHFGEFGKQGTGYDINFLYDQLRQILKVNRKWDVVLVGAGNLGKAIADYNGFAGKGFVIQAIFDTDASKVGKPMGVDNLMVQSVDTLGETIRTSEITVGIIATPAEEAVAVARTMIERWSEGHLELRLLITLHAPLLRACTVYRSGGGPSADDVLPLGSAVSTRS